VETEAASLLVNRCGPPRLQVGSHRVFVEAVDSNREMVDFRSRVTRAQHQEVLPKHELIVPLSLVYFATKHALVEIGGPLQIADLQRNMIDAVALESRRRRRTRAGLDSAYASSGPVGPLHCIPVLLKDQVETSDMPTTYGSAIFKAFVPRRDATITIRMKKAGAIILAKTTMGEFAAGNIGSAFGISRNAYDRARSRKPFRTAACRRFPAP
jgi:hypothetical protein